MAVNGCHKGPKLLCCCYIRSDKSLASVKGDILLPAECMMGERPGRRCAEPHDLDLSIYRIIYKDHATDGYAGTKSKRNSSHQDRSEHGPHDSTLRTSPADLFFLVFGREENLAAICSVADLRGGAL